MRTTNLVSMIGVCAVLAVCLYMLLDGRRPAFPISKMAGCYIPLGGDQSRRVRISADGRLTYRDQMLRVSAKKDKHGLLLLPDREIIATRGGQLVFLDGAPFNLRIDADNLGFTVPSKDSDWVAYRRAGC